jgi:hypothetical protein
VYAQRASVAAFIMVAVCSRAILAADPELKLGQILEGSLGDGDFVQIRVNPRGQPLIVRTYDPSGKPFRGGQSGPQADRLTLVAEASGAYRVEVAALNRRAAGTYSIVLRKWLRWQHGWRRPVPWWRVGGFEPCALPSSVENGIASIRSGTKFRSTARP